MNNKVKLAVATLLKKEVIVATWGIYNIAINDSSIEFSVQGFNYCGSVKIEPQNELYYCIKLNNGDIYKCNITELIEVLDNIIEKTTDYDKKLERWIIKCINKQ